MTCKVTPLSVVKYTSQYIKTIQLAQYVAIHYDCGYKFIQETLYTPVDNDIVANMYYIDMQICISNVKLLTLFI